MPSNIYRRSAIETMHDSEHPPWFKNEKTRRAFRFELVAHDTGFITEEPRRATGVEPAIPGIQNVCASRPHHRGLAGDRRVNNWTIAPDGWLHVIRARCAASKNGQDGTHRSAGPLLSRALPDLWPRWGHRVFRDALCHGYSTASPTP